MLLALLLPLLADTACGARSELWVPPPLPPEPECSFVKPCPDTGDLCHPVQCVFSAQYRDQLELPAGVPLPLKVCLVIEPVDCDDGDPCTLDSCAPESGECSYAPATHDLDGDGHFAPRPGYSPGEADSCGDDCDDTSPLAYPGNTEVCDGVDNDCNGVIDDGAVFQPVTPEPLRISGDIAPAGPGGLAFNGESYLSIYTGTSDGFDMYETRIDASGQKVDPIEVQVAQKNADSAGGPLVWIGDRYGLAWQDRRHGNYEAFFTLLDKDGGRILEDVRLSTEFGFSVNVDLAYNGSEFIVTWQDDSTGLFEVMARRVSVDGVPQGEPVRLSDPGGFDDEAPVVASGKKTIGLAYANGQAGLQVIRFRTFEQTTLAAHSSIVTLTDGTSEAVYPNIVWNEDHYLVAWYDRSGPVKAIFATTLDEDGQVLTPPTALSSPGAAHSRYPELLPLGDRALVIYADDRDGNQGYELYSRMFDVKLAPMTPEFRITNAPYHSIYPVASFGPEGNVGILFRDDRAGGEHHVWFTQLACVVSQP